VKWAPPPRWYLNELKYYRILFVVHFPPEGGCQVAPLIPSPFSNFGRSHELINFPRVVVAGAPAMVAGFAVQWLGLERR
jgi:hypothetical protein